MHTYENVYPFSVFLNSFLRISALWFSPETGLAVVEVVVEVLDVVYVGIGALVVEAKWWSLLLWPLWLWRSNGGSKFNEISFTDFIGSSIFGLAWATNASAKTKYAKQTFQQKLREKEMEKESHQKFLNSNYNF